MSGLIFCFVSLTAYFYDSRFLMCNSKSFRRQESKPNLNCFNWRLGEPRVHQLIGSMTSSVSLHTMSNSSSLIDWMTSQISELYAPHHTANVHVDEAAQLSTEFDAAFAPDAEIHLNHARVDREKFKEFIASRRSGTTQVECKPEDLIETPVEDGNSEVCCNLQSARTESD